MFYFCEFYDIKSHISDGGKNECNSNKNWRTTVDLQFCMKTNSRNTKQVTDNNAAYRLSREVNEDLLRHLNCASTAIQKNNNVK